MNILIIGCGYVGKALISELKKIPATICATTRNEARKRELSQELSEVHLITSPEDIKPCIPLYDVIIFCVGADSRKDYREAYLANAEAIASGLMITPAKKQQIIYTSSTSVYGDHGGDWVDETSELKPMTTQAEILIKTENQLLQASTEEKKICILRLGGIIGPGRSIEEKVKRLAGSKVDGDGNNYTNLSPLDEVVNGICFAIRIGLKGVYNLCSDEHDSRKLMYDKICKKHDLPEISWDPTKQSFHGGNKRVSSQAIKSVMKPHL